MRNWHPFLRETLAAMAGRGVRRALGIILSPLRTEASWDRYMADVADARAGIPNAPEIVFAPPWFDHPDSSRRSPSRRARRSTRSADARRLTPLVFTAHSVPVAMADASPYVADLTAAAGAVAAPRALPVVGRLPEPERKPAGAVARARHQPPSAPRRDGERNVVVVPIGFVCDHVEVLYDLDIEARRVRHQPGSGCTARRP